MKIFHCVESYYPVVGGMQEVVKQLSERLVQMGHEVIVLTRFNKERNFESHNGVKIISFDIIGNPKTVNTKADQAYLDFLLDNSYDVITFFAAQQWATDLALPILGQIKAKKVSVPTGYSGLYDPHYKSYFEDMKKWIHNYDMNIYLSDDYRDINFARENGIKKISLIPNGAAESEFLLENEIDVRKELNIPKDNFLILHVGSYTGVKGHREAVELFLKSDLKNATLLMIGHKFEDFKRQYFRYPSFGWLYLKGRLFGKKRIIFNFFSRDFTVAAYKQSNLFLFPSNIECSPIVLFEAAAAKLPFLATDVGNSVEISKWTGGGLILPTYIDDKGLSRLKVQESVDLLNKLYGDKKLQETMSQTAFKNWKEKYSWEVIAKEYEHMYLKLVDDRN